MSNATMEPGDREIRIRAWYRKRMRILKALSDVKPGMKLMQWTGLKSKDGTDIYEGDIVEAWSEGSHGRFEVRWRQESCPLFLLYPAFQDGKMWYLHGVRQDDGSFRDDVKILGNVFENPELRPQRKAKAAGQ